MFIEPEGIHVENNSSVIFLLVVGEDCILFMVDVGVIGIERSGSVV